jgi:hypothetical protein
MARFRSKPLDIDARRAEEPTDVRGSDGRTSIAKPGDWIITESDGSTRVVSDAIFRAQHEAIDGEARAALAWTPGTVRVEPGAVVPATPPPPARAPLAEAQQEKIEPEPRPRGRP